MTTLLTLFSLIPFYFLGAFPTGYLISRARGIDIAAVGSGNVGATNVARSVGAGAGLFTLIGDVLKGLLAVFLATLITDDLTFHCFAGLVAVAGHCFSIPGKLKGGKGVATALGVLVGLTPLTAFYVLILFILVLLVWRMVSLASVLATLSAPAITMVSGAPDQLTLSLAALALLIVSRHHENLHRIASGKEPRLGDNRQ